MDETSSADATSENVGYDYRDVVVPPVKPNFTYIAENPKNQYKLVNGADPLNVSFTVFDWKWLSNYT